MSASERQELQEKNRQRHLKEWVKVIDKLQSREEAVALLRNRWDGGDSLMRERFGDFLWNSEIPFGASVEEIRAYYRFTEKDSLKPECKAATLERIKAKLAEMNDYL